MKPTGLATLLLLAVATSACLDSGAPRGSETNLALAVAPLRLDGIGMACYDAIVTNGIGETVWARGIPGTPRQSGDTGALCSDQFGNGAGGDLAYVGPCDATEPNHNVTVFIDSLWSSDAVSVPLTDWVNPCPYATSGTSGCTLAFVCQENADVEVVFNLVVMREANQGFFDVAVNFDDVFCSAKLDCTYDTIGQNTINLLFHNGERAQTAVAALACTAGPNDNDETLLHLSHVRFRCGPPKVGVQANVCYGGANRTNERIYGMGASIGTGAMNMTGIVWDYDPAGNGSYEPSAFDPVLSGVPISSSGNYTTAWNTLALPPSLAGADEHAALCSLTKLGDNHPPEIPYPIEYVHQAICTENNATGVWSYAPLSLPATWLYSSLLMSDGNLMRPDFIVNPAAIPFEDEDVAQAAVFRYWGENLPNGMGDEDYAQAVEVPIPSGQRCNLMEQFNRTLVGFCDTGSEWKPHVWHIRDPGTSGLQLLIDDPGHCSSTATTFCTIDGDCPGGETCTAGSDLDHTDGNFTSYRSMMDSMHSLRTMASIQTLGGQTVPIITAPYLSSSPPPDDRGMRTLEYRRNPTDGNWTATAPVLAANGSVTYSDAVFQLVRGENVAMASGAVVVHDGPSQLRQAVFKYDDGASAWTVYTGGISIAGQGTFMNVGATQFLPNNLMFGVYSPCTTGPCLDPTMRAFVGVLPADPLDPIPAVELPVPTGFDAQPLDASGIQPSFIQRRGTEYGLMARVYLHRPVPPPTFNSWNEGPDAMLRWDVQDNGASAPSVIGAYVLDPTGSTVYDPPLEAGGVSWTDPAVAQERTFDTGVDSRWDGERHDCQSTAFTFANLMGAVGSERNRVYAFDITNTPNNVTDPPTGWELQWPASFTADANDVFEQILDLEQPKGNVWSPEHATDPLWQYALYYGNENLSCNGQSCNKRYFNVALGFDPSEMNCWAHFDATASSNGTDWGTTNGTVPTTPQGSSYPVVKYAVPLSGLGGLACRQNPLNGNNSQVNMEYTGFNEQQPFCFTFDGTNVVNHCTDPQPTYSNDPYFSQFFGGGGPVGGDGGGGLPHWEFRRVDDCSGNDIDSSPGATVPDPTKCTAVHVGESSVCWTTAPNGPSCTYKSTPAASCSGGANPGNLWECMGP